VNGRVEGKVALITGAGRGQGRSHAVRLAEEGADIIALDLCSDYDTLSYPMATAADLDETVVQVENLGRKIVATRTDVRDLDAMKAAVADGVARFGRLDVAVANAGVTSMQEWHEVTQRVWQDTIDTNLTGVWNTIAVSAPHMMEAGGGSIICTGSTGGVKGLPFLAPYVASKHGVVGIAKAMANELAIHHIRVNVVHPSSVDTPILGGRGTVAGIVARRPELGSMFMNALPIETMQPREISNAVLFLASDESRYVTGLELLVDAGNTIR